MSARPWMPLYVGDFIADTMHLGATETGIYMRLLMHCWQHGTIPRDGRQLALISHCDTRLWHQYAETVLQFFDVVDASTMHHKRVTSELQRCAEISNKRKDAAKQKQSNSSASEEQKPTHSQSHTQTERKEEKKESSLRSDARAEKVSREIPQSDWPPDGFEIFWKKYPHKVGKRAALKAYAAAKRSGAPWARVMFAVERYIVEKPPDRAWCNPATWFNQGRYDDDPAAPPTAAARIRTHEPSFREIAEQLGERDESTQPRRDENEPARDGEIELELGFGLHH